MDMKFRKSILALAFMLALMLGMNVSAASVNQSFATGASCYFADSTGTIAFTATLPSIPASDDGIAYLYQLPCYEYSVSATSTCVGQTALNTSVSFTFPCDQNTAATKLYSKFVLVVNQGGTPVMICNPQYIVNPDAIATATKARSTHSYVEQHGVEYDNVDIATYRTSVARTVCLINTTQKSGITNPSAFTTSSHFKKAVYYMMDCNTAAGVSTVSSLVQKLVTECANTEDWIIGNEVNVREWNYIDYTSWDYYMQQYEQVFRVCYNAIKSVNGNANVYLAIDQNWDRNRPASHSEYYEYMDGKDFLTKFASDITTGGNIDWCLGIHPYTVPLTYAKYWDMSGVASGSYYKNMISSNAMVSFQNMSIVTNFMTSSNMLNRSGAVRTIEITEVGASRDQGVDVQAACMYSIYKAATSNQYIKGLIFLLADDGTVNAAVTGQSQALYTAMQTGTASSYDDWAKSVIGISDWSQVIK